MTASQIRAIAELKRRAALLSTGQPAPVASVFTAEHARLAVKLARTTLR